MRHGRLLEPAPAAAVAGGFARRARQFLLHAWWGRLLLAALVLFGLAEADAPVPGPLAAVAGGVLIVFALYAAARASRWALRRLLWRIRTKLIVSYLFIAVVPVVLLTAFFLVAGLLGMSLVTSYMVGAHIEADAEELRALARATVAGLPPGEAGLERFRAQLAQVEAMRPHVRHALLRGGRRISAEGIEATARPAWLKEPGFAGGVRVGDEELLRGLWSEGDLLLIFDVPLRGDHLDRLERRTGLRVVPGSRAGGTSDSAPSAAPPPEPPEPADMMTALALVPLTSWEQGEVDMEPIAVRFHPRRLIERLSPAPVGSAAPEVLMAILAGVGATFLVLYSGALVVGLILARSITRSVHALSLGTERLRRGDFGHPIPVQSRDQLGELADSFNVMARDIQQLLVESAEKQRLEEELRIARQIQMSLLPQGTVSLPGLRIAALCLPAAEVGGDYYDLLPLSDTRLGVLVADVSGKGTSAALYMAELKGLVLSLSRIYDSPGRLLCEANRILSANMDSRSFITMTYAVVDTEARRMRFARAGHNPIIHLETRTGRTRVLAPPGMGLGLDPGARFEDVLEEAEAPLRSGDVFVFFTDGLPEAMNERAELFGERRLRDLIERSEALGTEQMKEAILSGIRAFVGEAAPHDDMTLVVLKVA
ncbi:MAG TPA: SpoIIE family protein phosphatase [Vicinamibacteria bacterium]|nr:SpoIIE family protein phosphatase [Vicinamibacteria bacterium]